MAPPDDFNPYEFLQDIVRRVFGKEVREEFSDIFDDDDDITIPRSALKVACRPEDNDTAEMLIMRMFFFFFLMRKAQDLQPPVYGMPTGTYHQLFKFRPQVVLYFREDRLDVDPDYAPLRSQISYRIMDDTETSITTARLTTLATRVKQEFGSNFGYRWKRGKVFATYREPDKGYSLRIFAFSDAEAKEVITKVLSLENNIPDWQYLNISKNEQESQAYPTIPPTKNILGKNLRVPRKRPVGHVRFTHATASLWGKTKPVTLYSLYTPLRDGLVK